MDFHTLLYKAQKNNTREKEGRYFKASLDPPKRETKESRQLSEGIKKFLAKKEEEDRQKQLEEQKKKDELLSLRSQDRKSFKRVQSMLNRTKSANKSVIEDAKDDINASVTMAEFQQPDEDDYGYVSKDAMDIYNKIMNKYVNTPAESRNATISHHRSSDIIGAKDRVRAALLKEEEDQLLPHKRKRKAKDIENDDGHHSDADQQQHKSNLNSEKPRKRPSQPPPLNFQELLKIAEKKQYEPIVIEKPKKKDENIPMMTKKEREKYLEEKKIEAMRNARRQGKCILPTEKLKEVKPVVEKAQKPTQQTGYSTKTDLYAEEKLKKNSSVWAKDFKIHKELNNNNNHKSDKYVPRPLNVSESIGNKSNGSSYRSTLSKSSSEKYSQNEKKCSSNEEPYSPRSKTVTDKYIPKAKNPVQDNYNYSPKPRVTSNSNDGYVPKSSNSSIEKYSPKPKSSMLQDKYLPKASNSTEKYVPKPRISNDDKYSSKPRISNSEKYSPKPKSAVQPDRYVPKATSTAYAEYTPSSVKRPDEKYIPKPMTSQSTNSKPVGSKDKYIPTPVDKSKKLPPNNNNIKPKQVPPKDLTPKQVFPPRDMVRKQLPPRDMVPKQFPPRDMAPKQFPPRDMAPKQFPPRDMAPKQFPPPDMRRRDNRNMPMRNKRQVIESDSDEYDSDLADFIDDGPEGEEDYSKVISEIFKYDKSKYRGIDDDDECMESDFRTLQKEEYRSSRAGLLEDLADIRREKAMTKKRKKV